MLLTRRCIGWTHHRVASSCPGPRLVSQRDAEVATWQLKRSNWLRFSATISALQIGFLWKSQLSLVAPGMNPSLSAVPGMGQDEQLPCLTPLCQPHQTLRSPGRACPCPGVCGGCRDGATRSPGQAALGDGDWIYSWKTTWCTLSTERGRSFPAGLGTVSCLQGDTEHLPAAWGSRCRDRAPHGKHSGGSGASRDSGVRPASQTQACGKVPRKFCSSIRKC